MSSSSARPARPLLASLSISSHLMLSIKEWVSVTVALEPLAEAPQKVDFVVGRVSVWELDGIGFGD